MNRKAKFAYGYIIIGFVLFLITVIFILNQNVNLSKLKAHSNFPKTNLSSQLSLFVIRTTSTNLQHPDLIELNWFCGLKYSLDENKNDEDTDSKELLITKEIYQVNFKYAQYWLELFSFIICASEQVYFVLLCLVCLSSGILCIFGCIRFYKYDIKLLENAVKFNSIDSFNDDNRDTLLDTKLVYDENKRDTKCALILDDDTQTKTRWTCCRQFFENTNRRNDENKNNYGFRSSISRLKNSLSSESNINFSAYMNSLKPFNQLNHEKSHVNTKANSQSSSFKQESQKFYSNFDMLPFPPVNHYISNTKQHIVPIQLCFNDKKIIRPVSQNYSDSKITPVLLNDDYSAFKKINKPLRNSLYVELNLNDKSSMPRQKHICMEHFTQRKTKFDQKLENILNSNKMYNIFSDSSNQQYINNDV
jgi:hypothetical protein